jgi:glucokinase
VTTSRHLGLDLGGTNLKVAVLEWSEEADRETTLLAQDSGPTHPERGPEGVAVVMIETGITAIEAHGPVATIGIGVPGLFDRDGVIQLFPNFPGPWTGFPLKERLEAGFGRPVVFINDARAHTLAESRMGAGRGARTMALVALGTGIGGGLIIDGKLHLGTGTAGELGHQTVVEDGPLCGCGNRGCVEPLAQAKAWTAVAGKERVEDVIAGVRAGDARSIAAMEQAVRYLGIGIANVVNVIAPDRVVVGGGIGAGAGDLILEPLLSSVRVHARMLPPERIEIVLAELGPLAGAIGAALAGAEGV